MENVYLAEKEKKKKKKDESKVLSTKLALGK